MKVWSWPYSAFIFLVMCNELPFSTHISYKSQSYWHEKVRLSNIGPLPTATFSLFQHWLDRFPSPPGRSFGDYKIVPTIESLSLPVISFTSPTVADELREASPEHGFFQLIDHLITQEMQDRTLSIMKSSFSLPTGLKMSLKRTDNLTGYERNHKYWKRGR